MPKPTIGTTENPWWAQPTKFNGNWAGLVRRKQIKASSRTPEIGDFVVVETRRGKSWTQQILSIHWDHDAPGFVFAFSGQSRHTYADADAERLAALEIEAQNDPHSAPPVWQPVDREMVEQRHGLRVRYRSGPDRLEIEADSHYGRLLKEHWRYFSDRPLSPVPLSGQSLPDEIGLALMGLSLDIEECRESWRRELRGRQARRPEIHRGIEISVVEGRSIRFRPVTQAAKRLADLPLPRSGLRKMLTQFEIKLIDLDWWGAQIEIDDAYDHAEWLGLLLASR